MQFTIGLVSINIIILCLLLFIYLKNLRSIKSKFTIGLVLFVTVFLIQNIVAAYFYFTMMDLYAQGTELPVLLLTIMQTLAFIIFLFITRE